MSAAKMKIRSIDVPILMYHHLTAQNSADGRFYEISVTQFEKELDLLRRWHFQTINFYELLQVLDSARPKRTKLVLITFDDAFRSFRELALPALKKRGMKATVFVPAGYIGGTNEWDRARGFPEHEIMSVGELREIVDAGTEIGSHGWMHRSLPACDEAQAQEEVVYSRDRLRELGFSADVFAYPYGEYSSRSCDLVRAGGYRAAVSIFSNEPSVTANRFAMRRVYVHPGDTPLRFQLKLSALYLKYRSLIGRLPIKY
jgi:peptidoglycan/xylan/chitin deacetylase (PgdA/CDA1 family)